MDKNKERKVFDTFIRELKGLPRVKSPEGLAGEVLQAIQGKTSSSPISRIALFRAPVYALAAALLILLGSLFYIKMKSPVPESVVLKLVKFECINPEAGSVSLVGDFNQWNKEVCLLQRGDDGKWFVEVALKPGAYQYQFLINGSVWTPDKSNPVSIDDGFGGINSGIEI